MIAFKNQLFSIEMENSSYVFTGGNVPTAL